MRARWSLLLVLALFGSCAGVHSLEPRVPGVSGQIVSDLDPDLGDADPIEVPLAPSYREQVLPLLTRYCIACHSRHNPRGQVVLDHADEDSARAHNLTYKLAAEAVRSGGMPPAGKPRPNASESEMILRWVETANTPRPNLQAARVTLRRLNRVEYNNTIRDLTGVDLKPANDFPADDTGDGFDTNGDVLSMSPVLIEKYLRAAETVLAAASANPVLWQRLTKPPREDFIPFVLRGVPPVRPRVVKGQQLQLEDTAGSPGAAATEQLFLAIQSFADRAYRRPATHNEIGRLMGLVETALVNGDGSDAAFQLAATAILVSPHFLFRVELDTGLPTGRERRLNGFQLATRLSYFLWSSMPDEELFRLAAANRLTEESILVGQVRRMLRDPRSRALAENFAGQWLQTRLLTESAPDPTLFPTFDAQLREAMRQETERFFDSIVREDRSVLDLITANDTFVNDRLAAHYGIPGVTGGHFRKVSLEGTGRAGVLTHASILTLTSSPTRTSPVRRGKWVLDTLLGSPSPAPPPGTDSLPDAAHPGSTMRQRIQQHRSREGCAHCHNRLDPIGLGLENFNPIGAWRSRDADGPIDPSGTLPSGKSFRSGQELALILAAETDVFVRCLATKLMTYGLGRSVGAGDRATVDRIVRQTARRGYRCSSLIIAIVRCDLFQHQPIAKGNP